MKTLNAILGMCVLATSLMVQSCKKDETEETTGSSIVPTSFYVDVPDAISQPTTASKSKGVDTISGGDIYGHLRTFIWVGDQAAHVVGDIITAITVHQINKPMTLTFNGEDDNRAKHLTVVENATYEGVTYKFGLTIIDQESASATDGGKALQVYWNTSPIKGIAILKPYNIDRTHNTAIPDVMYRVDYSEAGENGYDKQMVVSLVNLPLADENIDKFSMQNLKMFVGKKGNIVDVYGNSSHPNASFVTANKGYNYAFVASADATADLGVAEVGLPRNSVDASDRSTILDSNSVKNVMTKEVYTHTDGLGYPKEIVAIYLNGYLKNTNPPGYFNKAGFIQAGTAPSTSYSSITPRLKDMAPFNPKLIAQLSLVFGK